MEHCESQCRDLGLRQSGPRLFASLTGLACLCAVCLLPAPASGQAQISYSPAAQVDQYGNARPVYQRMPLAIPTQRPVARQAFRTYRWDAPSVNQRGAMGTLTLPTGLFARSIRQPPPTTGYRGPTERPRLTQWRRSALARFGGFEPRAGRSTALSFGSLMERRYALVAATGLNAPVYRAMLKPTAGLGVMLERTSPGGFDLAPKVGRSGLTFQQRLHWGVALAHERTRSEAWQWFREGEFRRAARGFESAVRLEPADVESRIGELFCHLSLGAVNTALAVQRSLSSRNVNPFVAELNLSDRYSEPDRARELGVESRLLEQGADRNADLLALHVLVLWYIGEQDEALATTASSSRDFADTGYTNWLEMMRAARGVLTAEDDKP